MLDRRGRPGLALRPDVKVKKRGWCVIVGLLVFGVGVGVVVGILRFDFLSRVVE